METGKPLFTPQLLLGSPRRSAGSPNPSGTTVLYTTSSYSFEEHSQTTTLQALLVRTGETIIITANQDISYINWLDDERFVCLRSEKDGTTSLVYARFSSASKDDMNSTSLQIAGIINATASCLKIARINHDRDDFAVAVSAPACETGRLYTPVDAARKSYSSGKLYDRLFVRRWDRYDGPERNSLWYGKLSPADGRGGEGGQYKLSNLTNLLAGTNTECPTPPFGGSDQFDVRGDAVIWLAKDPGINPSWNTKCNVYVRRIDSWDPVEDGTQTSSEIRQIDVAGFNGVAASPVFAPVGNKAAFLMMRKNRYEADKNQIFVVPDVTASWLEVGRAFGAAEGSSLEGTWDRSPSSVCFAADGESLVVVAEDHGCGRVFFVRGEDVATDALPDVGGQRQAVAIARTRLSDARIVLMDEPTAAISVRQVAEVLNLIRELRRHGIAVILVSHRMPDVFAVADRIVVLRRGSKVADKAIVDSSPEAARNLLRILAALTGDEVPALVEGFAGRGYGDLKGAVEDAVTALATPYRERTLALLGERTELEAILAAGAERARAVASRTLADVYRKVGLLTPAP